MVPGNLEQINNNHKIKILSNQVVNEFQKIESEFGKLQKESHIVFQ